MHSPLGPHTYVTLFWNRWTKMATWRYVPYASPEHTSEHVKSQNSLQAYPQTPPAQSILRAPLYLFALGPPVLSQPWLLVLHNNGFYHCTVLYREMWSDWKLTHLTGGTDPTAITVVDDTSLLSSFASEEIWSSLRETVKLSPTPTQRESTSHD